MEIGTKNISSFIIVFAIGLVLGAIGTNYYYVRAGGAMESELAAATNRINQVREQQQREIAELRGLVIALQADITNSSEVTREINESRKEVGDINAIANSNIDTVRDLEQREAADRESIKRSKQLVDAILRDLPPKTKNN